MQCINCSNTVDITSSFPALCDDCRDAERAITEMLEEGISLMYSDGTEEIITSRKQKD